MIKALVVDDIESWRIYHAKMLNELFDDINIEMASCAKEGYDLIFANIAKPYDIIITDLQMENDFEPKYAGEWLVEQTQSLKNYFNAKVVISSAAYNIRYIAEQLNVDCIPKKIAMNFPDVYNLLKEI